jgi:hypothetical protein
VQRKWCYQIHLSVASMDTPCPSALASCRVSHEIACSLWPPWLCERWAFLGHPSCRSRTRSLECVSSSHTNPADSPNTTRRDHLNHQCRRMLARLCSPRRRQVEQHRRGATLGPVECAKANANLGETGAGLNWCAALRKGSSAISSHTSPHS